jgi:class 3 adenylate cyclase
MTENTTRKLAAIMFADIAGYSRMMSLDENLTLSMNDYFIKVSSSIVSSYKGKIKKKIGDAVFCEFNSSKNAVDASMEIQKSLSEYNHSQPKDFKLLIRIGIHIGDIVVEEDGVILEATLTPSPSISPSSSTTISPICMPILINNLKSFGWL